MKTKKTLAIILTFILCFGVLTVAFADETAQVPEGYTPVYTAEDLSNIRNDLDGKYILMNDIDLSVYENWEPIGTEEEPFTGELDGNGQLIKNLAIDTVCTDNGTFYFGLFGYVKSVGENSIIKNVSIIDAEIDIRYEGAETGKSRVGILCGYENLDTISNCAVSGDVFVKGFITNEVGGIVGRGAWSDLNNCTNYSNIQISVSSTATQIAVGGIIGTSKYTTENECCNYGDIDVSGDNISEKCYVRIGGTDGNGSENAGIQNCYNRGDISVNFSNPRTFIGGLSGESLNIYNSYNIGKIIYPENFNGYAGAVSGNLIMSMLPVEPGNEMKNVYYNDKTMIPAYDGMYMPEDFTQSPFNNVKILSDEEFKMQESFVGFDFENVWIMEENGYPVLRNQPVLPERIPETPTTESTAESTTEPLTEPSTESTTEPSNSECPLANLWIVRAVKWLMNLIWDAVVFVTELI